jgi:MtaA/CmuA family methyltransferase
MKPMTSKERIDAVLAHQSVDRVPFALVDGGAWIAKTENLSYRQLYGMEDGGAAKIVKWTDEVETDVVSAVSGVFTACLNAFGCPIHIDEIGRPVDAGAALSDPESEIPLLDKSTIREKLLANEFVQGMLRQAKNVKALAGERKYLLGDIAGPFTMAAVLVGTQDFIMLIMDDPDLVEQLMDFTTAVSAEMFKLLLECGCDIAMPAEPVASGSLISQKMFDAWVIPALKNLKDELKDYKYFFTHVCGASGSRVKSLRDAGVLAFSGDYLVDLEQALTDADGRLTMMGNINPAGVLLTGTPEEGYAEACERIKAAAGRGHILAPGCDMGAATPIENVKMLGKACKDTAYCR